SPIDVRMLCAYLRRDVLGGFSDDLKVAHHRIKGFLISNKLLPPEPLGKADHFLTGFAHIFKEETVLT
ncbi:MAG: hypothetical protein Q8R78_05420, partial [Candidatus Omnitrophota bacterium]|nr:hypothetical protein [Candidatus Omnitrophota bacterium]